MSITTRAVRALALSFALAGCIADVGEPGGEEELAEDVGDDLDVTEEALASAPCTFTPARPPATITGAHNSYTLPATPARCQTRSASYRCTVNATATGCNAVTVSDQDQLSSSCLLREAPTAEGGPAARTCISYNNTVSCRLNASATACIGVSRPLPSNPSSACAYFPPRCQPIAESGGCTPTPAFCNSRDSRISCRVSGTRCVGAVR